MTLERKQSAVLTGLASERPPAVGNPGLFLATDTGVTSYSDGATWSSFGGGGGSAILGTRVKRATAQPISASTWSPISWSTEVFDDLNVWNSGTPTKLVIASAGLYILNGAVGMGSALGSSRFIVRADKIASGGSNDYDGDIAGAEGGGGLTALPVGAPTKLDAGDAVELAVYQTTGAAVNTDATLTFLSLVKLA